MLIPAGVEEALFKPTPNGWIFSAPNPWTFARRRSYLVDDVQKVELAVRVRHSRYFRVLASIAMSALPLATFLLFPSMLRAPSVGRAPACPFHRRLHHRNESLRLPPRPAVAGRSPAHG